MKSYDETVDTVLQRIHSYNVTKERRKKALLTALPVCILCLAALTGFGLWQAGQAGGGLSPLPMTANLPAGDEAAKDSRTIGSDQIGYLIYGEKYYLQEPEMSTEGLETGDHLGKASVFEGAYKDNSLGVDGEVYTIKGHDNLLGISLSNGAFIILKETSSSPEE